MHVLGGIYNLGTARIPNLDYLAEHLDETAPPVFIFRREISAAEKWL
jgi:hypothetical protein